MSFFASNNVAPFLRFVMEFTTWLWLFILFIYSGAWLMLGLFLFSVLSLALLNYPGDKRPEKEGVIGIAVPGKVRVLLEIITAFLGLLFGLLLLGIVGGVLQLIIVFLYLRFDTERLSWMWGWRTYPPTYVTELHKLRKDKSGNEQDITTSKKRKKRR